MAAELNEQNVPAPSVDVPVPPVDVPAPSVDAPISVTVDVPAPPVDAPIAVTVDVPAPPVDAPIAVTLDVPVVVTIAVDVPIPPTETPQAAQQTAVVAETATVQAAEQPQLTGDRLPGYQEACVIAANNLRELDMKSFLVRLQRRYAVSGVSQTVSTALLVLTEALEIVFLNPNGCFAAGVWSGGVLLLAGLCSAVLGRQKRFREELVRKIALVEILGLVSSFICCILFIRHWMSSNLANNLYVAFQVMHIAKLALAIFIFIVVVSKVYLFYRFRYCYRDLRTSNPISTIQDASAEAVDAIVAESMRNASLSTIFDELERNSSSDEELKYVEPPPDYDKVVVAPEQQRAEDTTAPPAPTSSEAT